MFVNLVTFVLMELFGNHSLELLNTFRIAVAAEWFAVCESVDDFKEAFGEAKNNLKSNSLILGGGSNILFTRNYAGLVLKNNISGISLLREDDEFYYVKVGAGENWHQFVMHCVNSGYAGIENLSLIPGSVGAGPMQNIGAYGVELKDVFHELTALHRETYELVTFSLDECAFDYRSSVFKTILKDQFVIVDVTFRLNKKPVYHTSYGAINEELQQVGISELSIKDISDAVIRIRQSKLPDPAVIGNAGSFFKNPSITNDAFSELKSVYPNIPGYPSTLNGFTKTAAGWLIEQCGWKGFRKDDYGVHAKQALVLVNYENAPGQSIYALSSEIIQSVHDKFGIELEREVNIY
jgi:UDP-N-acetylmuramate dehydrogenase